MAPTSKVLPCRPRASDASTTIEVARGRTFRGSATTPDVAMPRPRVEAQATESGKTRGAAPAAGERRASGTGRGGGQALVFPDLAGKGNDEPNMGALLLDCSSVASSWMTSQCS